MQTASGSTAFQSIAELKVAPKEEATLYEGWKKQLRYTKQAAVEGKLAMLPMFHYDPRRWQTGSGIAFREVGTQGVFIGFKEYTRPGLSPLGSPSTKSFRVLCSLREGRHSHPEPLHARRCLYLRSREVYLLQSSK